MKIENRKEVIYDVGFFCKDIRTHILKLTLKEFCEKTTFKLSTISAFENGRSTNMKFLFSYLNMLPTDDKLKYLQDVVTIIEKGGKHGKENNKN